MHFAVKNRISDHEAAIGIPPQDSPQAMKNPNHVIRKNAYSIPRAPLVIEMRTDLYFHYLPRVISEPKKTMSMIEMIIKGIRIGWRCHDKIHRCFFEMIEKLPSVCADY